MPTGVERDDEQVRVSQERVSAFWDQARGASDRDDETGYLTDEWPRALARNRFAGEWRDVRGWLDEYLPERGACLDVGCGTGLWLEHLAPLFTRAQGFDISRAMAESARRRLADKGVANVAIEQGSITELTEVSAYDLIFVGGVLMYLSDDEVAVAVAGLRRALRPGGLIVLRESTNRTGTRHRDAPLSPGLFADPDAERPPYYAIYRHAGALRDQLEHHGLRVQRMVYNRHYKLSDMTEGWLWFVNRLYGGRLRSDRALAERWAQRIYKQRWLTLLPYFYTCRALRLPVWNMQNHFYLCR